MNEWINRALEAPGLSFTLLAALFLLGVFAAVASACNIAVIGAITGYAGASESNKRRDAVTTAISFMLGSILALTVIGVAIGYAGQIVGKSFGRYSKIAAGLVLILFGLISLNLFPFKLPKFKQRTKENIHGILRTVIFAFVLGGSSIACCLSCCSPALLVVLGIAGLHGHIVKSAVLMGVFGMGYSIPLAAVILGISFGKWSLRATRAMPFIKGTAGVLLLGAGFYFLATI